MLRVFRGWGMTPRGWSSFEVKVEDHVTLYERSKVSKFQSV